MSGRGQLSLFLFTTSLALPVYLVTLAPTVSGEDSGELITAAHSLGIAHPPGYPLWCLLGKLFSLVVPFGGIAYRVNLLSAVIAACASGVIALLTYRFLRIAQTPSRIVAAATGCVFAFSREFWAQSVIAEVYSLNILFLALVLWLVFLWDDTRNPLCLYLLTFAYGLSLTNHSTMGPLGLILAAYVLWRTPWILRQPHLLLNLFGTVLVGASLLLYLPIRSLADPAMDWGNPETLQAALRHILRRQYAGVEGVRPREVTEQLILVGHFLKDLSLQFTPILAALLPLGALKHWRVERRSFLLLSLLFAASSLGIIWLFNYPAVREDLIIKRTFYLPAYAVSAVWLALGLGAVILRFPRRAVMAAAAVAVLLPLAWHYRENDKSDYYFADDYGRNLLASLKADAIVVPTSDHSTFPLIFLQSIEGLRPDVLIADRYGDIDDETLNQLFLSQKGMATPPPRGAQRVQKLQYLIEHTRRPVFVTVKEAIGAPGHELVPRGLAFEALPKGQKPSAAEIETVWQSYSWRPGTFNREHRDYTADMVLSDFHQARARRHLQEGRTAEALADVRTAAAHGWGIKEVLNNIGGELADAGLAAEAIPHLLAAWAVQPGYATARRNLAVAYEHTGRHADGLPWYRLQLEETPYDPRILRAAAQGARQVGARAEALGYYFRLAEVARGDVETLKEVKAYLEGEGCAPELVASYEERIRQAKEAEERRREEFVRRLEEEGEPGDEPPIPRPPVPQAPLVGADPLSELQRGLAPAEMQTLGSPRTVVPKVDAPDSN